MKRLALLFCSAAVGIFVGMSVRCLHHFFAIALALVLATSEALAFCSSARTFVFPAKIERVVDGDTVVAEVRLLPKRRQEMALRLAGIDAPEIRASDAQERTRAVAAAEYLAARTLSSDVLVRIERQDNFGRWLADVWVDDECVNSVMVAVGLAKKYKVWP